MSHAGSHTDDLLHLAAEEELGHARCISWRELSPHVPYGDSHEGFDQAGREVEFERAYLWKDHAGGDIMLEVTVRRPGRDGREARATALICDGACND